MKPSITTGGVADQYAAKDERIVEFSFPNGMGGLISFGMVDGVPVVELYRMDDGIRLHYPLGVGIPTTKRAELAAQGRGEGR